MDRPQATAITLRGEFLFKSLLKLPEVDFPPKVSVVQLTWVFFSRVSVWRQDGILRWVSLATNRLWKTCGASSLPRVLVRSVAVENTQGWYHESITWALTNGLLCEQNFLNVSFHFRQLLSNLFCQSEHWLWAEKWLMDFEWMMVCFCQVFFSQISKTMARRFPPWS